MNRRNFLISSSAVILTSSCTHSVNKPNHIFFAAGGSGDNGGIHLYKCSADGSLIVEVGHYGIGEDHGFQCYHNGVLYSECSVGPRKNSRAFVKAYRFDPRSQNLTEISSLTTEAKLCHMETQGSLLVGTSYGGAYIESFQLSVDGRIEKSLEKFRFKGASRINPKRQNAPHPHAFKFSPDGHYAFMPDLGRDIVQVFEVTGSKLKYRSDLDYKSKGGAGPRHFTFHPDGKRAYLINELDFTLTAFDYSNGKLTPTDTQNCLPKNFSEWNSCADVHVHPNGKFVYASNRGHNSLAIFSIEKQGKLKLIAHQSTKGEIPRNFAIHQNFALVANQHSNNLVFFSINPLTGKLEKKGSTKGISRPSCVNVL